MKMLWKRQYSTSTGYTKLIFILILVGSTNLTNGQSFGVIKGKLQDSITKKNLAFATVTIFNAFDTTMLSYKLSDPEGNFRITKLPLDVKCRVLITFSGYKVYRHDIIVSKGQPEVDLGLINFTQESKMLDEILVFAEYPPVIVRNDTIEFNASSFKTLPNALLEDLLKKLPGVNVTRNGDIFVNGKTVNKIIVDGKEFFGRDPKIASQNLPSNIIEKVQVFDDSEQLEQNFLLNKSDVGKIINLKLKKGVKKGIFGKIYGGLGSEDRYEGGGIANLFRDTIQISLLGYSNNLNRPGFGISDVKDIGGFNRSGYSSSMISQNGAFALDGISFGATSDGIQTSSGAGFNFNTEFGKKISANLTYFFGQIKSDFEESINSQQFLSDSILNIASIRTQDARFISNRLGSTIKWNINPTSLLTIKPTLSFTDNNSIRLLNTTENNNKTGPLNQSDNRQNIETNNTRISTDINFRKRLKKGKTIGFISSFLLNNNREKGYSLVNTTFFGASPIYDSLNQLRAVDNPTFGLNISGRYAQPISESIQFSFSHLFSFTKYDFGINSFHKSQNYSDYNILIDSLSNKLIRKVFNNTTSVSLDFKIRKAGLSLTLAMKALGINGVTKNLNFKQNNIYLLPGINFRWNGIFFTYFPTVMEPRTALLLPILDNTNPLFIQLGNLELLPTTTHSFYLTYDKYNSKKSITYRSLFSSFYEINGVVTQRYVDGNGVQKYQPLNSSGLWRFRTSTSVTKDIKLLHNSQLSIGGTLYADYNKTNLIINNEKSWQRSWNLNPTIRYSYNCNDKINITQEFTLSFSKSRYENNYFQTINFVTNVLNTDIIIRATKKIAIESAVNYYHTNIESRQKKNTVLWNVALNKTFLKNSKANLKFSIYNLLRQSQNISRILSENYISDIEVKNLDRYFLISLTYNLRNFEKPKFQKERLLLF